MTFRVTNREFNVELTDRTSTKFRSLSAELEQEVWIRSDHYMKCTLMSAISAPVKDLGSFPYLSRW